ARDQLAQTQASFNALKASKENDATEQLRAQIADLKNEVAVAEEARATAEKQRDEANVKLAEATKQIAAVGQQRDEALAQLKVATETGKGHGLDEGDSANMELTGVKDQLTQLQQQLADSQKQNQYLVAKIAELSVQLDETGVQLQKARLAGKNSEETDRLLRENELLRNIVVRERQEEARRDEVRKLMLAELNTLKIKSDVLNKEIEFLARPVTKLSSEELSLLRQPVVSVSDENGGVLTASFIFAKKSAGA